MTLALIPTAVVLTMSLNAQVQPAPADVYDTAPGQVRTYVEEVECITLWRGRQRRTYCRVIRRVVTNKPVGRTPNPPKRVPAPPPAAPPPAAPPPVAPPPAAPPSTVPPLPRSTRVTPFLTSSEARVMQLLNTMRRRLKLHTLTLDKAATRVARAHSRDMCRRRFFAHKNPDGKMPWDRLKTGGVKFRATGENIASGQPTALSVHQDWNNSPGHRRNRLNKNYRRMGIGVYWCAGVPYWTEVFMR